MYTLIVRSGFEAAHCIPGHPGKCANLHGHGYRVEAEFSGESLNEIGMVADFGDLRQILTDLLPDHRYLNDLMDFPTTAENIARWIYDRLRKADLPVTAVTVWETDYAACRYAPSENAG